ncbi:beta-ketoacyl-ACP synthase III [Streptomyces sp. 3MP-14]|uniref:Beta-ketoacyl-[acyl-carrier-protein] synthase III n=1 Tax=Streptomyces mimosae TaxID=2586635 RepID=A0A5N6A2F6_9ACTN|nr:MULTISPECIES: beta-ketoacyl-ACP synthase III [Streptomyces]KAB8162283.1 beta-ketoacyl-ACP synthase III [Streptomyces mimosae]KAB8173818.1 beta-ketoacyl-ACP synthase III [Streptomyces sp. 3MP-14]
MSGNATRPEPTGPAAVLCGLGGALPARAVSNDELAAQLDTSDAWIRSRTGIGQRHVIAPGQATSDLAVEAGARALASARDTAGPAAAEVDLLVLATSTPDRPCPATAPVVAQRLGLGTVPAFDVAAVCTGFVYALATAGSLIEAGVARRALVIGADTFSTILDPADRTTRALFGDGAGAVVLRAGTRDEPGALLGYDLGSDGQGVDLITVRAGGSRQRSEPGPPPEADRWFTMRGSSVFREAVLSMSDSARALAERTGWDPAGPDKLVAHQANVRILRAVGDQLGLDEKQIVVHLDRVGNTVAASIPLALTDAAGEGALQPGHRVLLTGFGGGLTWGSAALVWPDVVTGPPGTV